jgi:hypothetical protein
MHSPPPRFGNDKATSGRYQRNNKSAGERNQTREDAQIIQRLETVDARFRRGGIDSRDRDMGNALCESRSTEGVDRHIARNVPENGMRTNVITHLLDYQQPNERIRVVRIVRDRLVSRMASAPLAGKESTGFRQNAPPSTS